MKISFTKFVGLALSLALAVVLVNQLWASSQPSAPSAPAPTPTAPSVAQPPPDYVPVQRGGDCCEPGSVDYVPKGVYEAEQKKKAEDEEKALLTEMARRQKEEKAEKEEQEKLKRGDPGAVARTQQAKINKENDHWMGVRDNTLANIEYNNYKEQRGLRDSTNNYIGLRMGAIEMEQGKGDKANYGKIRQWNREIQAARQNFETQKQQIKAKGASQMQEATEKYNAKFQGGKPPKYSSPYGSGEDYKLDPKPTFPIDPGERLR